MRRRHDYGMPEELEYMNRRYEMIERIMREEARNRYRPMERQAKPASQPQQLSYYYCMNDGSSLNQLLKVNLEEKYEKKDSYNPYEFPYPSYGMHMYGNPDIMW